jgi:hypothetical protein
VNSYALDANQRYIYIFVGKKYQRERVELHYGIVTVILRETRHGFDQHFSFGLFFFLPRVREKEEKKATRTLQEEEEAGSCCVCVCIVLGSVVEPTSCFFFYSSLLAQQTENQNSPQLRWAAKGG